MLLPAVGLRGCSFVPFLAIVAYQARCIEHAWIYAILAALTAACYTSTSFILLLIAYVIATTISFTLATIVSITPTYLLLFLTFICSFILQSITLVHVQKAFLWNDIVGCVYIPLQDMLYAMMLLPLSRSYKKSKF